MANWKTMIEEEMRNRGEAWSDIVSSTLTDAEASKSFDDGFGGVGGQHFTVWTEKTVYFPVTYDGIEWVGSVSRHPDGRATPHHGGG